MAGTRYVIPFAVRLRGRLDSAALRAALVDVVDRHEVLRTVFPDVDGIPMQDIVEVTDTPPPFVVVDCADDQIADAMRDALAEPYDLTRDLPMRTRLYALAPEEHVLLLVIHHIASDAWSMGPLMRDLSTAYTARRAGMAPDWQPLPVQFADYTLWHNDMLGAEADPGSTAGRQLAFWREALADLPLELTLPTDRPRPAVPSYRGGVHSVRLGAHMHQCLEDLALATRTTLFMVLHAALVATLSRLGAGTDVPVGTPVAGRADEALDDLVGFFVNSVALRVDLSGDPTFRDLLGRVRDADIAAFGHQDLPFDRVVDEINPPRSLARPPLFQLLMTLRSDGTLGLRLPGLDVRQIAVFSGTANFDLTFDFVDRRVDANRPDGLDLAVIYSTDLFDAASVRRLTARLHRVLTAVVADADTRISRIDLLDPVERERILREWNSTSVPVEPNTLPRLFTEQAARTPDRTAVVFEGAHLSYAELDSRARRLARAMLARGVGPGSIVAVALPRSFELIVALYAVHKAGAAYLPIEQTLPQNRVDSILGDAKPVLVLTCELVAELLEETTSSTTALPRVTPEQPAYVIYTSGSTGEPKGVVVPHAAIVNRLLWMQHEFSLGADDRVLHKTPTSFDVSVWELFWPLLSGARLVVAKPDGHKDPRYLAELMGRAGVSVTHFVPSMLEIFVDEPATAECRSLRTVICSGEALPAELARRWTAISSARLYNLYGPTEAAVDVTSFEFRATERGPIVPIGRPMWNTQVYVLDERLQPVPPGVPGELYLAGVQLAIGYLNRPRLTAERFVASPFGSPGARMYRTGDLVRWRSDGNLEFLGRNDDQVKIRGARVELGEISGALVARDDVAQAAVVVRCDRQSGPRVIAYVVLSGVVDSGELRRYLTRLLPDYMVPSAVVPLATLPLTTSGKLDRRALPDADPVASATGRGPRTSRENALCRLFADVLGLPAVSIDDNFFALGGHSLLAMRLVTRARDEAGLRLEIGALFETPTVAGLVAAERTGTHVGSLAALLPLRAEGSRPPLFCLPPAAGISWIYAGLLGHLHPDQPVYGLQSPGLAGVDSAPSSLDDLVGDHLDRIRAVRPSGPYRLMGWSFGAVVAYATATRLQAEGAQVSLLAMLDGYPGPHRPVTPSTAQEDPEIMSDLLASLGSRGADPDADELLAELGSATVSTLIRVFGANRRLMSEFEPEPFHGDVLFFVATADKTRDSPTPMAWRPHVRGRLLVHELACAHGELARPAALAEVGSVLSAAMPGAARAPSPGGGGSSTC